MLQHFSRLQHRRFHLSRKFHGVMHKMQMLRRRRMGQQEPMQIDHAAQRIRLPAETTNTRLGVAMIEMLLHHTGDQAALYNLDTKFMEVA